MYVQLWIGFLCGDAYKIASVKAAVLGASGYAGTELLRLAAGHPELDVALALGARASGRPVGEHTPALASAYPDLLFEEIGGHLGDRLAGIDVVFSALPHGESQAVLPELRGRVGLIIDLAADFRLRDPAAYPRWYGEAHRCPEVLAESVYGLPELHREQLRGAGFIAAPGCYPTAAILALWPLASRGLIDLDAGVIVDAASGVSGAGRSASDRLHFGEVDENFKAYGLLDHRHTPEMEQEIGATVLFTPHLAPMTRGILATCYARPTDPRLGTAGALDALGDAYGDEPFVSVVAESPATKSTSGSNTVHVTARVDPRTGWVVALSALDNLVKGAAGQAIQAMNVAADLPETSGLPTAGMYP